MDQAVRQAAQALEDAIADGLRGVARAPSLAQKIAIRRELIESLRRDPDVIEVREDPADLALLHVERRVATPLRTITFGLRWPLTESEPPAREGVRAWPADAPYPPPRG